MNVTATDMKASLLKHYAPPSHRVFFEVSNDTGVKAKRWIDAVAVGIWPSTGHEIVANRHRLVTRKSAAFVGYCRQQASKYGIKGSRVAAARAALALLDAGYDEHGSVAKLSVLASVIEPFAARTEHVTIFDQMLESGTEIRHLDVCGRKLPYTSTIKNGREILQKLVDEYGRRALQAESQQGVDWKALSHAVRVACQAIELLETAHVTFPLPNREHVMAIKQGLLRYQDVATEIEELLVAVERAAERSFLPDQPDRAWIDDFVTHVHGREVRAARPLA